jgi:hypothetical protein
MNTLIFIPTDVKSRRLGGATQPLGLRWGFETTSIYVYDPWTYELKKI